MAQSITSSAVVPTMCAACGAERDLVRDGERTAARCAACGSVEDVAIVCAALKKWSVVDEHGTLRSFASKGELIAHVQSTSGNASASPTSTRERNEEEEGPVSDVGDVLSVRDLMIVSVPPLPAAAKSSQMPAATSSPPPPLPRPRPKLTALAPPLRHEAPSRPPRATSSAPPPPTALEGASAPKIEVGQASERDITIEQASERDITIEQASERDITIEQASEREIVTAAASATPPARASRSERAETARVPKRQPAPNQAEAPRRDWFLPAAVVAVVAGSIVYAVRSSPRAGGDPPSDVATARAEEKPTIAPPAVSAGGAAATVDPAVSGTATSAAAQPAPAPAVEKTPAGAETGKRTEEARADERKLTLSELLTSASTARRGGDAVRARALLERALVVSPGNVEAHAGLGDLARASGDLANARTSYEKALATSPTYAPALLALADTEWELGDRAAAERHYRALVATASSPPERAKTRAGSAGAAGTTTTPAPAIKTLTEADFPPPAPAAPKPNED